MSIGKLRVACLIVVVLGRSGLPVRAAEAARPSRQNLFVAASGGYHTYRIPALVVTPKGTVLAFCEGRKTSRSDHGDVDLVLKRSTDSGKTWTPMQLVHEEGGTAKVTIGNACPVVDRDTGTVWLPFTRENDRVFVTRSSDEGATWSEPTEITARVKKPGWGWYATGPGNGIQLRSGRLVVPCDHRVRDIKDRGKSTHSHVIYSDDHGKTWQLGGSTGPGMNECEVVELANGSLLLSMRNYRNRQQRAFSTSTDGGKSWSEPSTDRGVFCPVCQSSLERWTRGPATNDRLLYMGPAGPGRSHMTVRLSPDEGRNWPIRKVLHAGPSAYSSLAVLPSGDVVCLYEAGENQAYERIVFAKFSLEWLTGQVAR